MAIYCGYLLAKKRAPIYKIPNKIFDDSILILPLIFGIIGARIYHVLDYWSLYSQNILSILYLNRGGLGIWGALVGIIFGFYLVCKFRTIDFSKALDLIAPSLLLGQVIGRFANYVNQEAFGRPTNLPWGIFISQENRPIQYVNFSRFHPTFFYESALNLFFLILLLKIGTKLKHNGQLFALYLIFYAISRALTEFFRFDTAVLFQIKISYLFSIVTFVAGLYILKRSFNLDKN